MKRHASKGGRKKAKIPFHNGRQKIKKQIIAPKRAQDDGLTKMFIPVNNPTKNSDFFEFVLIKNMIEAESSNRQETASDSVKISKQNFTISPNESMHKISVKPRKNEFTNRAKVKAVIKQHKPKITNCINEMASQPPVIHFTVDKKTG